MENTKTVVRELHQTQIQSMSEIFHLGTLLPEKTKIKLWFNELNRQARVIKALKGGY